VTNEKEPKSPIPVAFSFLTKTDSRTNMLW
jgi:hypothetical protein